MSYIFTENLKNTRLDLGLLSFILELKRGTSKRLVLNGAVKVNGNIVKKPNYKLKNNDEITIDEVRMREILAEKESAIITPVKMELNILFEDNNLLAINKPSGIVTHPSYKHKNESLLNGVIYYVINNSKTPFCKPRAINRLDKGTSGMVLFSKNIDSHNYFSVQFKKRNIYKEYIAIVAGDIGEKFKNSTQLTIRSNLTKSPNNLRYKSTNVFNSEPAETEIKYLGRLENGLSTVKIVPKTGRTHQIRVHLSELGFPILGDTLYGGKEYSRLMLHSHKLRVNNLDRSIREIKANLPVEFTELFNNLINGF